MTKILIITFVLLLTLIIPIWSYFPKRALVAYILLLKISILGIYWKIGGLSGMTAYEAMERFNAHPEQASYQALQERLQKHIDKTADPLSHLLQARLYFAAQDYQPAVDAFERAYVSLDKDTGVLVEYATAVYFLNPSDARLPTLIANLQEAENKPLAAHSLLANIAMDRGDTKEARIQWEALLKGLPPDSEQIPYVQSLLDKL